MLDMYRVIPFARRLDLSLLVSCLPVLLLNFENQCRFVLFCMFEVFLWVL